MANRRLQIEKQRPRVANVATLGLIVTLSLELSALS